MLNDPSVPLEDKNKIKELLRKPWNPYIRRHSALTEKSKILKEHVLRQYAGWSPMSNMHLRYIHYFGNESTESLLKAYGIMPNDQVDMDKLAPKLCPNCNEPNKVDSKFCSKCRMVMTYNEYLETLEKQIERENEIHDMKKEMFIIKEGQRELFEPLRPAKQLLDILENE